MSLGSSRNNNKPNLLGRNTATTFIGGITIGLNDGNADCSPALQHVRTCTFSMQHVRTCTFSMQQCLFSFTIEHDKCSVQSNVKINGGRSCLGSNYSAMYRRNGPLMVQVCAGLKRWTSEPLTIFYRLDCPGPLPPAHDERTFKKMFSLVNHSVAW